jgi:hypothetical protein
MARIITKGLIGVEDINFGTSTFTRATSVGGTQILHQVNSSNLGSGFPLNTSSPITPTGAVNGINTIFTLPTTPGPVVLVYRNGLLQKGGGVDYTLAATTITFVSAPLTGDLILAVY